MQRYNVEVTEPALRDIDRILGYLILLSGKMTARKYLLKFNRAMRHLEIIGNGMSAIEGIEYDGMKISRIRVERYVIFYTVIEKDKLIRVLRVGHSLMDWKKIFSE